MYSGIMISWTDSEVEVPLICGSHASIITEMMKVIIALSMCFSFDYLMILFKFFIKEYKQMCDMVLTGWST